MNDKARLVIRVQPNARQNEIVGFREGVLHLKIAAPPVKGRANQQLVEFLGEILGVAKSRVIIEKGKTGRKKFVSIRGLNMEDVNNLIKNRAGQT